MDEKQFAADLMVLIFEEADEVSEAFNDQTVANVETYREAGIMSGNAGIVVTMKDGSEFQITVVQSRPAR